MQMCSFLFPPSLAKETTAQTGKPLGRWTRWDTLAEAEEVVADRHDVEVHGQQAHEALHELHVRLQVLRVIVHAVLDDGLGSLQVVRGGPQGKSWKPFT